MRTIAHISDVHFGREDPAIVEGLLMAVAQAEPDLVVVSGDLTQRARKKQFRAARAFLEQLPAVPQIVIPGNHDISLTSMVDRAFKPFKRFKKYIADDLEPYFEDEELAVAGINTVRKTTVNDGRIKQRVVKIACDQLSGAAAGKARVIVTHHPMDVKPGDWKHRTVSRARAAMKQFGECGVDLFLSGHLHSGRTIETSARYKLKGYAAVVVHAGTAVSTRRRGEPNAWNIVRVEGVEADRGRIDVEPLHWNGKKFQPQPVERYRKGEDGWALKAGRSHSSR
jgi:3',5'-cyclic AMP phosphodiesterase CpdA